MIATVTGSAGPDVADRLRAHVEMLAGAAIGERNMWRQEALGAAREVIAAEWAGQGYAVRRLVYSVDGVPCTNLEVIRPGRERPSEILLLGAHYDSVVSSPGANDNASGVAALLELSRRFVRAEPTRTVRMVAFVNEESPFFGTARMGSLAYAREARARGDDIRLMVSLETMGYYRDEPGSQRYPPLFRFFYPEAAAFVAFVSNFASRRALRQMVEAFRRHSNFPAEHLAAPPLIRGLSWSDHSSFWRQGYPAVMVTDTAFYRYDHYHTRSDTPDQLSYGAMARVVDGLAGAILDLAASERIEAQGWPRPWRR
jgi:Zn-dependent M28 family amino/carboxypeptidase